VTGAALALGSAACFGVADYAGGLLARRASAAVVAMVVQVSGALLVLVVSPLVPAANMDLGDLLWGAVSGIGTATGLLFLYRGLTRGSMSVVVPLSTVGAVALPVVAGVMLLQERPSVLSWLGIVLAFPAIALVSGAAGPRTATPASVRDASMSSAGFALQYIALAQAGPGAGLWPVAAGRGASVVTMLVLAALVHSRTRLPRGLFWPAAANGVIAAAGLTLYMFATRQDIMAVAVVLSSLYPVIPVVLGIVVLRERLSVWQAVGFAAAASTVVLVTIG
jgi:uncharacterized membrane protein